MSIYLLPRHIYYQERGDTFQQSAWIQQQKTWLLFHVWKCERENSLGTLEASARGVLTLPVPMLL